MANSKSAENRSSPRRAFRRPVGILFRGRYEVIQGLQISEGGMLIESDFGMTAKDRLVVSIILPGGDSVIARAQVVYLMNRDGKRTSQAFGLQFVDLELPKRRLIRNYVAAKTEMEAEIEAEFKPAEKLPRVLRDNKKAA